MLGISMCQELSRDAKEGWTHASARAAADNVGGRFRQGGLWSGVLAGVFIDSRIPQPSGRTPLDSREHGRSLETQHAFEGLPQSEGIAGQLPGCDIRNQAGLK